MVSVYHRGIRVGLKTRKNKGGIVRGRGNGRKKRDSCLFRLQESFREGKGYKGEEDHESRRTLTARILFFVLFLMKTISKLEDRLSTSFLSQNIVQFFLFRYFAIPKTRYCKRQLKIKITDHHNFLKGPNKI